VSQKVAFRGMAVFNFLGEDVFSDSGLDSDGFLSSARFGDVAGVVLLLREHGWADPVVAGPFFWVSPF
jgi:hypothetical protein